MGAVDIIRAALAQVLPQLNSNASIESKIVDVVGTVADSYNIERENTLNVINTALAEQKVTGKEYYRRKAIAFQNGDALSYDPVNYGGYYENIDPQKQIIKQAYISGTFPSFFLLVNKIGSDGHLTVLSDNELASFRTYFAAFQPIGMNLQITSLPPAVINAPDMVVYVEAGSDASSIASQINAAFTAQEKILRNTNTVYCTEIDRVVLSIPGVTALFRGHITATDTSLQGGGTHIVKPEQGILTLTSGAFTFGTEITPQMIKVLQ